ncbi:uncharacterized protein TNCV_3945922 [Trichonephila clavipes]|nr:uncharacterized protein TNCV_3945922 [Trichonephila clavipes]
MDALKLRRTPLRTAFTKAVNHLQEIIENDPVDKNAVETAFEMLDAKSVKLKKIDEDILELMIETNCTQEAYNIEFEAIEGYTEKMINWQVRVKNIMKTDALGQKDNHSLVTSSSSSLRLPKIQFQQFSGELTDWLRFHNQFKRIHEDESIDDGDKFPYLIQATTPKSRARDIVESFPATPENYRKAFEYLRMRFGQEDVLIQVYVRELLKLVLQNTEVKKVNLSSLYDKIEAQLRALESLGVTKEKYAAMLFPLVESCLPAEILRAWERYVGYSSDESDISGRYEVALPWVLDNKLLSSNRKLAENRLESTKRKLIATGKFEEYQDVLDLWLSGKIIEEVNDDKENFVHYLRIGPLLKKTVQAKARVAPLKDISIPRLELLACVLGTRLAASVKNDLNLPDVRIYYLTDSMTALAWIQRTRDWGVFVSNRVKEIRNLSDVSSWEHVPSEKNFADILSRAQQLVYLRWWEGPSWLSETPVQCPRSKQVPDEETNRTLWSLARVIQLIPGKDGHVRVARVKTETGELARPVQRLYNLELQEPDINLSKDLTDSVIRTRRGRRVISPKRLTYA